MTTTVHMQFSGLGRVSDKASSMLDLNHDPTPREPQRHSILHTKIMLKGDHLNRVGFNALHPKVYFLEAYLGAPH